MPDSVMQQLWSTSHLDGGNASYVEELYELYLQDPVAILDGKDVVCALRAVAHGAPGPVRSGCHHRHSWSACIPRECDPRCYWRMVFDQVQLFFTGS